MELLTVAQLGSPIILHAGNNALHAQQEKVATSLRRVMERASTTFPDARGQVHPAPEERCEPLLGLC